MIMRDYMIYKILKLIALISIENIRNKKLCIFIFGCSPFINNFIFSFNSFMHMFIQLTTTNILMHTLIY